MKIVTESAELAALCPAFAASPYVAVDTEFMRETTYWPKLCFVQLAAGGQTAAIDTLAEGLVLDPLFDLMRATETLKVFHAGRQDLEIFHHLGGVIPTPLFDTQVAAMVCGFGNSVAYDRLVAKLVGARIDKTSRYSDWSRRPLTERQVRYALDDVVHLGAVYETLARQLESSGRTRWLDEEMAVLSDPATYEAPPDAAWRRIKARNTSPRFLAVLREVAAWREIEAQTRDVPRNRVLRDEALLEIAGTVPRTNDALERIRAVPGRFAAGERAKPLLAAIARGAEATDEELPHSERRPALPGGLGPLVDLLKVLLKTKCEANDVAQKLVANTADLERIAAEAHADVPALKGWRNELFGRDALALKAGRLALAADRRGVRLVTVDGAGRAPKN